MAGAKARANVEALAALAARLEALYTTHHRNVQAMINGYLHNTPTVPADGADDAPAPAAAVAAVAAAGPEAADAEGSGSGSHKRKREPDDEA